MPDEPIPPRPLHQLRHQPLHSSDKFADEAPDAPPTGVRKSLRRGLQVEIESVKCIVLVLLVMKRPRGYDWSVGVDEYVMVAGVVLAFEMGSGDFLS